MTETIQETKKNPLVDAYLIDGCGRCKFYRTPQCKVNDWRDELIELRRIALASGLTEELKWKMPCYTLDGANILIGTAFREYAALAFFKGALLKDPEHILIAPGENSQSNLQARFTSVEEILAKEDILAAYIREAIEVEKSGKQVALKETSDYPMPEELLQAMQANPDLKTAFEALTPGRQRGYLLHFASAKQSKTRTARIEKYTPKILAGKGMQD